MANNFKSQATSGVTTVTTVYTAGQTAASIVIGCMLANTTNSGITATVKLVRQAGTSGAGIAPPGSTGAVTIFIVDNLSIPAGSAFDVIQGNKLVMAFNTTGQADALTVTASAACDVLVSVLEGVS